MILQFIDGLRGDVHVTFEEGTSAAWLYDLLKPHVTKLVVCDPRKNASMREGNQSDKIAARRLAELLRRKTCSIASRYPGKLPVSARRTARNRPGERRQPRKNSTFRQSPHIQFPRGPTLSPALLPLWRLSKSTFCRRSN
jgi:hypothetical protein